MANAEHLNILRQGVNVWNQWRHSNSDVRPDLWRADLWRADLSGAHLSGARYSGETQWPEDFDPKAAGAIWVKD